MQVRRALLQDSSGGDVGAPFCQVLLGVAAAPTTVHAELAPASAPSSVASPLKEVPELRRDLCVPWSSISTASKSRSLPALRCPFPVSATFDKKQHLHPISSCRKYFCCCYHKEFEHNSILYQHSGSRYIRERDGSICGS